MASGQNKAGRRSKKPWYREQTDAWYTTINGKQVKLTESGGTEAEAWAAWHQARANTDRDPTEISDKVAAILNEFLAWTKENRKPKTYEWYRGYLKRFHKFIGVNLLVSNLKPLHVDRWIRADDIESNNNKRGAARAVKRAMAWALEMGMIKIDPLATMKMAPYERGERCLTEAEFKDFLAKVDQQDFRDYLTFMWEVGCRPQEIRAIETKHIDEGRIFLPLVDSKGNKRNRVIYLNNAATTIVERLRVDNDGPLFRNMNSGKAWTDCAIRYRFRKMGESAIGRVLRHTWITRALKSGIDTTTVAVLAGHKNTTMVQQNYQHLALDHDYLGLAANKVQSSK